MTWAFVSIMTDFSLSSVHLAAPDPVLTCKTPTSSAATFPLVACWILLWRLASVALAPSGWADVGKLRLHSKLTSSVSVFMFLFFLSFFIVFFFLSFVVLLFLSFLLSFNLFFCLLLFLSFFYSFLLLYLFFTVFEMFYVLFFYHFIVFYLFRN